mmetsp:Transcript_26676/g.43820  ORF Transcript_26676/g.43820 Transcript_26676/m.43820 type:complete len:98 (+) Transcript_26676:40-333(+)
MQMGNYGSDALSAAVTTLATLTAEARPLWSRWLLPLAALAAARIVGTRGITHWTITSSCIGGQVQLSCRRMTPPGTCCRGVFIRIIHEVCELLVSAW